MYNNLTYSELSLLFNQKLEKLSVQHDEFLIDYESGNVDVVNELRTSDGEFKHLIFREDDKLYYTFIALDDKGVPTHIQDWGYIYEILLTPMSPRQKAVTKFPKFKYTDYKYPPNDEGLDDVYNEMRTRRCYNITDIQKGENNNEQL